MILEKIQIQMQDGIFVNAMASLSAKTLNAAFGISETQAKTITIADMVEGTKYRTKGDDGWSSIKTR